MTPCPELHVPHKDSQGREERENWLAIERWARTRGCGGATCYIEHREVVQRVEAQSATPGYRADMVKVVWDTVNTCGTLTDEDAMLILTINWSWQTSAYDPFIDASSVPYLSSGRGVFVFGEGLDLSDGPPLALDTRLGLGTEWYYDGSIEGGSLTIPLNLYPAGQGFDVWIAHNSTDDLDWTGRADLYIVGGCGCVL